MRTVEKYNKCRVPKIWYTGVKPWRVKHHLVAITIDPNLLTNDNEPVELVVSKSYSRSKGWRFAVEPRWLFGYSHYELKAHNRTQATDNSTFKSE